MEKVKIETIEKIEGFLKLAYEREDKFNIKINDLEKQKENLEYEKKELSIALIDAEVAEDNNLVNKIDKKINQIIGEIISLDTKIEMYIQYTHNYSDEIYKIMESAAKDLVEGQNKYNNDLNNKLKQVEKERDAAKEKYEKLEEECRNLNSSVRTSYYEFDKINKAIVKIIKYMPEDLIKSIEEKQDIKIDIQEKRKKIIICNGQTSFEEERIEEPRDYSKDIGEFLTKYYKEIKRNPVVKQNRKSIIDKYFK